MSENNYGEISIDFLIIKLFLAIKYASTKDPLIFLKLVKNDCFSLSMKNECNICSVPFN